MKYYDAMIKSVVMYRMMIGIFISVLVFHLFTTGKTTNVAIAASAKRSLSPIPDPRLSSAPTISMTAIPTPTVVPSIQPTQLPTNIPIDTSYLSQINEYRMSKGKSPLSSDSFTCAFAQIRAGEIAQSFSHAGFEGRRDSSSLGYPSYTKVVENIAMGGQNPVVMWIGSPTHEANLIEDLQYGCVGQSGMYFTFEGWTP